MDESGFKYYARHPGDWCHGSADLLSHDAQTQTRRRFESISSFLSTTGGTTSSSCVRAESNCSRTMTGGTTSYPLPRPSAPAQSSSSRLVDGSQSAEENESTINQQSSSPSRSSSPKATRRKVFLLRSKPNVVVRPSLTILHCVRRAFAQHKSGSPRRGRCYSLAPRRL